MITTDGLATQPIWLDMLGILFCLALFFVLYKIGSIIEKHRSKKRP